MIKGGGFDRYHSMPLLRRRKLVNIYYCLILICTAINIVVHDIWVPIKIKLPTCKHNLGIIQCGVRLPLHKHLHKRMCS